MDSLRELFTRQEGVVGRNLAAAPDYFRLIERGLVLGWAITVHLNGPSIVVLRRSKSPTIQVPETITMNLLHSAWSGLVNATRLMMYGAHCDSLALIRSAYEAVYHAEYFRHNPSDAVEWDHAGHIVDLEKRRQCIAAFNRKRRVRQWLGTHIGEAPSRERMFSELSTYGTHANPITVGLRLSSNLEGVGNLGFLSVGKVQATQLCASHCLHILIYALSEFFDGFPDYLAVDTTLRTTYDALEQDRHASQQAAPTGLSLAM